jgi:small ligand-binding sensory domain FIST
MPIHVATAIIQSHQAKVTLAEKAIQMAMKKAKISRANAVLLIVSTHFSEILEEAIFSVAQHAQTTQVLGCTANGFFTEDDWVLDSPAVAVMVLAGDVQLQLAEQSDASMPLLTIAAPNAINAAWLNNSKIRYGGVSGDATGQGKYVVWQNAKAEKLGHAECTFIGLCGLSQASHGFTLLSQPITIQETSGFDLIQLAQQNVLTHLKNAWRDYSSEKLPLHKLTLLYADHHEDFSQNNFAQASLISLNETKNSVTLSHQLNVGQSMIWAVRDKNSMQMDLANTTQQLLSQTKQPPAFALMFSTMGRGPFEDGIDHDLNTVTRLLKKTPLLGFYGNGVIAHIANENQLLPYSVVLNIFAHQ